MPPKFERCVKGLMEQGKSKSAAYAICVSSTGLKPGSEETEEMDVKQIALKRIEDIKKSNPDFCDELDKFTDDNFLWVDEDGDRMFPYKDIDGEVQEEALKGAVLVISGNEDQVPIEVLSKLDDLLNSYQLNREEIITKNASESFMSNVQEAFNLDTVAYVDRRI